MTGASERRDWLPGQSRHHGPTAFSAVAEDIGADLTVFGIVAFAFVSAFFAGACTGFREFQALPLGEAVMLAAFGAIGALIGELAQRVFYAHAQTHLDPPAASIVVTSLLIAILVLGGIFPNSAWISLP